MLYKEYRFTVAAYRPVSSDVDIFHRAGRTLCLEILLLPIVALFNYWCIANASQEISDIRLSLSKV
jgi:hypothetical protein